MGCFFASSLFGNACGSTQHTSLKAPGEHAVFQVTIVQKRLLEIKTSKSIASQSKGMCDSKWPHSPKSTFSTRKKHKYPPSFSASKLPTEIQLPSPALLLYTIYFNRPIHNIAHEPPTPFYLCGIREILL